ncbi:hypothetical protein ESY86_17375 [Subsaximicrobium wynnwilliamsii]|uniref:Uncharacterized protein n=1 Tax=Subsaximicrobium wynnwilliamsii TaxID=291179 RepID=A0A5C6ZC23_9FLAO|nr:hypothetical protein [Subsaximicrobium wynnwilliamsii]TXD81300.1 hypothetical protein ESY87_18590 [Subsaximicrobium wynnwilliamsii]TXD87331.1 hypothetical protein ESY86_17375 [Subsaximicrobium wynnwilliamsii]TXE00936.1 hypothetical protein ESY88_17880 [Subsaximicrobium wynnwilliamsii]
MDELDLLKKDWQQKARPEEKQLTSKELHPMLFKKSSSIVKTLFYISIAELLLWVLINTIPYFSSKEYRAELAMMYGNEDVLLAITIFSYSIILVFVYLLFRAHQSISVTDTVKNLMKSILKTRKVIKYYVIYNLVMAFLAMCFGLYESIYENPKVSAQFAHFSDKQKFVSTLIMLVVTALFVGVIWLFYRLIYGILLKRLNKNYAELKKLEV